MLSDLRKKIIENNNNLLKLYFRNKINSSYAFTLSEILIAMCIMGVLAAMLIPVIMQSTPDYNKVMFRKSLYSLQVAVNNMIKDQANYPRDEMGVDSSSGLPVEKGFNYTTATTNGLTNKFCYLLFERLNTIGSSVACPSSSGSFTQVATTSDGIVWKMAIAGSDGSPDTQFPLTNTGFNGVKILFDVNGSKAPNCTKDSAGGSWSAAVCGPSVQDSDQFIVGVRYDGKIQVACSTPGVEYCGTPTDPYAATIVSDPGNNKKPGS